jgi:oligopeptide transport system substrate-binding protein
LEEERNMFSKKLYRAAAVTVLGMLVLTACGGAPQTVVVTAPPEEIEVEVTVPVTAPPEEGPPERCTYNAYRMGWVMDYGDANNIVNEVFHPDAPFQYTFWDDEEFRSLVDQALVEDDTDARVALWQQAQDILLTDYAAVLPIFHYDRTLLVNPELGFEYPAFGQACFMYWSLPEGRDTIRYPLGTEPPTLDVNLATDTTSHLVLAQLMEGLYRYRGDGSIEPAGAVSYDVSEDGTTYTVTLAEEATWSDGEPVLAQHYVDGILRLLNPETAAEYAYVMYYISGAQAYNTGETDDPSTVGVSAVDDYTLQFTLDEPQAFFPAIMAFFTTWPIRLDVVEEYGDLWTEPGNFVGNGPYVLTEWAHEDHVTVEKNPNYHLADQVTIERAEFPIIVESATALAAYERGELDASGYPSEEQSRIMEEMPDHLQRLPYPGTYYVGISTALEPTDNLNLRKALVSSVDRRAILDAVLDLPWRIDACGVIPPEILGYQACGEVGYDFNVDAALDYLAAAMDEMGVEEAGDIDVELWFNRGNEEVIEAVEEMWESNLGVNVNVVNMEWGVYLETLDQCND